MSKAVKGKKVKMGEDKSKVPAQGKMKNVKKGKGKAIAKGKDKKLPAKP